MDWSINMASKPRLGSKPLVCASSFPAPTTRLGAVCSASHRHRRGGRRQRTSSGTRRRRPRWPWGAGRSPSPWSRPPPWPGSGRSEAGSSVRGSPAHVSAHMHTHVTRLCAKGEYLCQFCIAPHYDHHKHIFKLLYVITTQKTTFSHWSQSIGFNPSSLSESFRPFIVAVVGEHNPHNNALHRVPSSNAEGVIQRRNIIYYSRIGDNCLHCKERWTQIFF